MLTVRVDARRRHRLGRMRALCALRRNASTASPRRSRACPRASPARDLQICPARRRRAQRGRLRAVGSWRPRPPGCRVWQLAGLPAPDPRSPPIPCRSTRPRRCGRSGRAHAHRPLLKIKLGTPDDMPRLEAVRAGRPETHDHRRRQRGLDAPRSMPTLRRI